MTSVECSLSEEGVQQFNPRSPSSSGCTSSGALPGTPTQPHSAVNRLCHLVLGPSCLEVFLGLVLIVILQTVTPEVCGNVMSKLFPLYTLALIYFKLKFSSCTTVCQVNFFCKHDLLFFLPWSERYADADIVSLDQRSLPATSMRHFFRVESTS
ncbi:hypothetical protein J6590_074831 [Homalodisca vitripennis]|nr:hypothetical protein J6590_074831 [Homalodisca vitripennis]